MSSIMLDSDKYAEFIRCLSLLKDICNDVDIRDGFVRCRTTENTSAFEIDLRNLIGSCNIPLVCIKQKLDFLKCFCGYDVTINVSEREGFFTFSDNFSSITINFPSMDLVDNKYMTLEELNKVFHTDEEDLILKLNIDKAISDRMKIITQGFNSNSIQIMFNGESCSLMTRTRSKDQKANFLSNIVTEKIIENTITNISNVPFIIDHDNDIQFRMYNVINNTCVEEFRTKIGSCDVSVYSRSSLINND